MSQAETCQIDSARENGMAEVKVSKSCEKRVLVFY